MTVNFHYKRRDNDYKDWSFWVWERDKFGKDFSPREVEFDKKNAKEDEFGRVLTLSLSKTRRLKKIGFVVKKAQGENRWKEKDGDDRFIPIKKGSNVNVYIIDNEKEFFFNKEDANRYLNSVDRVLPTEKEAVEKIKIKIHYSRYNKDYDGWNIWLWEKDRLSSEKEGREYYFTGEDDYGKYAEFYKGKSEGLTQLGIIIKRNNWEKRDIYINRYIDVTRLNEKGELEVFLLQDEENIVYKREDVDASPKILKSYIDGSNRICAVLNYAIEGEVSINDFKVKDGKEEVEIKGVNQIGYKFYEILTKDELLVTKRYTLLRDGYGESQVSLENRYDSKEFKDLYVYDKEDLGLTYGEERSKFKVWAPTASSIKICLYADGIEGEAIQEIEMDPSENGTWEKTIKGNLKGLFYTYKVNNYGKEREAVDIYAKAVGVNGERGAIVDLKDTDPSGWDKDKGPVLKNIEDAIIYEVHVRDLTIDKNSGVVNKGKFLGLTEKGTKSKEGEKTGLSHIEELGVTHVHLLPIFDFSGVNERVNDGKYNWGYNPENYNVPEGSYSTNAEIPEVRIMECKKAIKALHDKGIGVIMDVVYNHTAKTEDSNFNKIVPGYYHRKNSNGTFSNGSGCGNETSSEREMTGKMIRDSLRYWMKEYHIDGFRFDLMGLHDFNLMNKIREEMDAIKENVILYGEGWTGYEGSALPYELQARREHAWKLDRIGTFNDTLRDAIKGANTESTEREAGFANGAFGKEELIKTSIVAAVKHPQVGIPPKVDSPVKTINYVSAHDNLTLWDKINCTNGGDMESERIKIDKLSAAIVLTSQGIPFIHGGEEFLRTKGGVHNSYNSGDEVNKFDWYRKSKYIDVNNYYKRLIRLRKGHPAFRMTKAEDIQKNITFIDMHIPNVVAYTINNNANGDVFNKIVVIFNANTGSVKVTLPDGVWAKVIDGRKEDITTLECVKNIKLKELKLKHDKSDNELNDNELWVEGRTAVVLADALSVKKELELKNKIKGSKSGRKVRDTYKTRTELENKKRIDRRRRELERINLEELDNRKRASLEFRR